MDNFETLSICKFIIMSEIKLRADKTVIMKQGGAATIQIPSLGNGVGDQTLGIDLDGNVKVVPGGGGVGGTPALPFNSVQFNNAGAFGGSANFMWDNVNGVLQIVSLSTGLTPPTPSGATRNVITDANGKLSFSTSNFNNNANNGLSIDTAGNIVLGNDEGAGPSGPGRLLTSREIPLDSRILSITGSGVVSVGDLGYAGPKFLVQLVQSTASNSLSYYTAAEVYSYNQFTTPGTAMTGGDNWALFAGCYVLGNSTLTYNQQPNNEFNRVSGFVRRIPGHPAGPFNVTGPVYFRAAAAFAAEINISDGSVGPGNELILSGWWSSIKASVNIPTNYQRIENYIGVNIQIQQPGTNRITNGYGIYINLLGAGVVNRWAIYQESANDKNFFAGPMIFDTLKSGGTPPVTTGATMMVVSDSTGLLSFAAIPGGGGGGGTPAVPFDAIQFNNAGAFGGSGNLMWDNVNGHLNIGVPSYTLGKLNIKGLDTTLPTALFGAFNMQSYTDTLGFISNNSYWNGTNLIALTTGATFGFQFVDDTFNLFSGASVAAGTPFTWSIKMLMDAAGGLKLTSLQTGGAAPTTTGTTMMVICDANGLLSFAAIPGGGGGTPASPANSVQFNNAGAFGGSGNLIWDNVNGRLGVNKNTPTAPLHVGAIAGASGGINFELLVESVSANLSYEAIDFIVPTSGIIGQFFATANNYGSGGAFNLIANSVGLIAENDAGQLLLGAGGSTGFIAFNAGGYSPAFERMRISANGTINIAVLATGLTPPVTTGTTKMVIVDANGMLSNAAIPSSSVPNIRVISANDTVLDADDTILVNTAGGPVVLTYPVTLSAKIRSIKKMTSDVNTVTVTPSAGTIDGAANAVLSYQYEFLRVQPITTDLIIV